MAVARSRGDRRARDRRAADQPGAVATGSCRVRSDPLLVALPCSPQGGRPVAARIGCRRPGSQNRHPSTLSGGPDRPARSRTSTAARGGDDRVSDRGRRVRGLRWRLSLHVAARRRTRPRTPSRSTPRCGRAPRCRRRWRSRALCDHRSRPGIHAFGVVRSSGVVRTGVGDSVVSRCSASTLRRWPRSVGGHGPRGPTVAGGVAETLNHRSVPTVPVLPAGTKVVSLAVSGQLADTEVDLWLSTSAGHETAVSLKRNKAGDTLSGKVPDVGGGELHVVALTIRRPWSTPPITSTRSARATPTSPTSLGPS